MSKLLKPSRTIATPPPDPLSVVNDYLKAFNAGDIAKLVTYYADDITSRRTYAGGEFSTNTGIAEEMAHIALVIAEGAKVGISNATVDGDTVKADMWLTMPKLQAASNDPLTGPIEYVVEQGKIVRWKATLSWVYRIGSVPAPRSISDVAVRFGVINCCRHRANPNR